jgi:hypothetical protein
MLTAQDGFNIAQKLGAQVTEGRNHTKVLVVIDNVVIGRYGLSRGTREQNHDYIAKQIGRIGPRRAKQLSLCPLSKEEYVEIIRDKGLLAAPQP